MLCRGGEDGGHQGGSRKGTVPRGRNLLHQAVDHLAALRSRAGRVPREVPASFLVTASCGPYPQSRQGMDRDCLVPCLFPVVLHIHPASFSMKLSLDKFPGPEKPETWAPRFSPSWHF